MGIHRQSIKAEYARIWGEIARGPRFERLSRDSSDRLAAAATIRKFANGQVVDRGGRHVEGFFVILSGGLRLAWPSPSGGLVPVAVFGEGSFYGFGALADEALVEIECRALGDTVLAHIGRGEIRRLIAADDGIREFVTRLMLDRLRAVVSLYVDVVSLPLPQRLARRLFSHALSSGRKHDTPSELELPMSQSDLAQMLGVSRSRMNTELRRLENDRVIRLGYRRLVIRDVQRLRQLAGPSVQAL